MMRSQAQLLSQSGSTPLHKFLYRALRIVAASAAIAATARIAFPLPFTPVPFTLQPLAILATGLLLGPTEGALAVLLYLLEGAAGLPVFSPTGPGGLAQLFGPTGGYLLADPLVAWIAGFGARRFARKLPLYWAAVFACLAATVVLFAAGAGWLAHLLPLSPASVWQAAVGPFLPGELVKILIAAGFYRAALPSTPSLN